MKKRAMIIAALLAAMAVNGAAVYAQETEKGTEAATEAGAEGTLVLETELETEGAQTEAESEEEDTQAQTEETEAASEGETEAGDPMEAYRALDYVTLGEYKGLTVELGEAAEITEEQVDETVKNNLLDAIDSGLIPALTEGKVQTGDVVNLDYKGTLDGEAFDGGTAEGFDLEIGSGRFIEGFEDGMVGMGIGEEKDLNLTFPENYHSEELAGKAVVFHVKVNSIKRPELTDETASMLEEGKTAQEYRDSVRAQLEEEMQQQRKNSAQAELLNQVFANAVVEGYPTSAFEYEFSLMKEYYETMAGYYNSTLEDFLAMYGTDLAALEEMQLASLTQEMVMLAVAEQEGMELDDAAYEKGAKEYAEAAGGTVEELEAQYSKNYIRNFLMIDKAVEFLTENANFVEPGEAESDTEEASSEVTDADTEPASEAAAENETAAEEETAGETETEK